MMQLELTEDTAAINSTNDNVSDPVEGQQSTYTALDFNHPDNSAYQEIILSHQDKKSRLKVSRKNESEDISEH